MTIAVIAAAVLGGTYAACLLLALVHRGWIEHAVRISAPLQAVWDYGSDSTEARNWSVFFDHITPHEGEGRPKDGTVGAFRICYRNADERGPRWSETTVAVDELDHRQIHTFDLREFQLGPVARFTEFEVHQYYEAIDERTTRMTFRARLQLPKGVLGKLVYPLVKATYVVFAKESGRIVFVWNLENIAAAAEARHHGHPYERPHPYAAQLEWEAHPLRWWWSAVVLAPFRVRNAVPSVTFGPAAQHTSATESASTASTAQTAVVDA